MNRITAHFLASRGASWARSACAALATSVALLALAACGGSEPEGMQTGAAAPDFSLPDVTGQTVSLSDYAGTPVLLFFHMAVG